MMIHGLRTLSRFALSLAVLPLLTACVVQEADAPPDPVVTFPTWTADHDQSQVVQVAAPPGWKIDHVEYSVDGGKWTEATPTGTDNGYTVALTNLDIGPNTVALRVESSYRDQSQTDLFYSTTPDIAPVFDCTTPAASMLPSPTLQHDNGTEVRTMVGYFGDPAGGHDVTFTMDFTDGNGNAFQNVGSIVSYGSNAITVSFNVATAWCNTNPGGPGNGVDCDLPYGLTVSVDGVQLCTNPTFGVVHNYWERGG